METLPCVWINIMKQATVQKQSNVWIQCNPYQVPNFFLHRTLKNYFLPIWKHNKQSNKKSDKQTKNMVAKTNSELKTKNLLYVSPYLMSVVLQSYHAQTKTQRNKQKTPARYWHKNQTCWSFNRVEIQQLIYGTS